MTACDLIPGGPCFRRGGGGGARAHGPGRFGNSEVPPTKMVPGDDHLCVWGLRVLRVRAHTQPLSMVLPSASGVYGKASVYSRLPIQLLTGGGGGDLGGCFSSWVGGSKALDPPPFRGFPGLAPATHSFLVHRSLVKLCSIAPFLFVFM